MSMPLERPPAGALAFLTVVRLVVNTGQRFVYPFLPALARGLGISLEQAGLLLSVRSLAGLATPGAVRAAGRGEHRARLIVLGLALFALGAGLVAATGRYLPALAGFLLLGLAKPVYDVGAQSYLADRSDYRVRARYLSVTELTWAGGLLVGAPAAGWLIAGADWRAPFWALAALAGLALAATRRAIEPDEAGPPVALGGLDLSPSAKSLLVATGLFAFGADVTFVVFGAWLEESFGVSLLGLGGASFLIGAAELAGEGVVVAFTDRLGKRRAVALGLAVASACFGLLAVTGEDLLAGLITLAVALAAFEVAIVSTVPLATELVPGARSRFLSLGMVAYGLARAGAAAVGPPIFARLGVAGNALVSAGAFLAALVVLLRWVREG